MGIRFLKLNLAELERAGTDPALLEQLRDFDADGNGVIHYEEISGKRLHFSKSDFVTISSAKDFRKLMARLNAPLRDRSFTRFSADVPAYETDPSALSRSGKIAEPTSMRHMSYDEIDAVIRRENGMSLYDYCDEPAGLLDGVFAGEEDFKTRFPEFVTRFYFGDLEAALVLFNAYAEENHFTKLSDGSLAIGGFFGMNAPHAVVLDLLNELFDSVSFDAKGVPHGIGTLNVDAGYAPNDIPITIDFDKGVVSPPLRTSEYGHHKDVAFADLMSFINIYIRPGPDGQTLFRRTDQGFVLNEKAARDTAMTIFIVSGGFRKTDEGLDLFPDSTALRHEIHHALYDGNPIYRDKILARARASTPEERECAILYLCDRYDVFDPDALTVTRDIVIDEAFNAYANEGIYDAKTGLSSRTNTLGIMQALDFDLSLSAYHSIAELPLSENEKEAMRAEYERLRANTPSLSEMDFLNSSPQQVFACVRDMRFLLGLIREQDPGLHARIVAARKDLIDWVD